MIHYKLSPGQSIQLTTNSIFYKNIYESKLLSVQPDCLEISTPYYKGLHVPLNIGFKLNLKIHTPQGMFAFTTEVTDRNMEHHSIYVKLPQEERGEESSEESTGCKFVTVSSGKGGVGKTSFIINYALTLAAKGKKVVLMDADLGMANVDVLFKVNPRYNLIDVIDGNKKLHEILVDAPGGIKLIPGGSGFQELANLTSTQFYRITTGFDYLESNFDYVLIDTGAGLSKNITNFILASDETIVVTTPEPHAITDAYSMIKVILDQSKDVDLKLVINKCDSLREGEQVANRIIGVVRNFLSCNLVPMGNILDSKVVTKSIREQVPLYISYPHSDVARCIDAIVNKELGELRKEKTVNISGFVSKFKSFFGKSV